MPHRLRAKQARFLIAGGALVPCLLLAVSAVVALRAERLSKEAFERVSHTLIVQEHLQELLASLANAAAGVRGYLLTSRDIELDPYRQAIAEIGAEVSTLQSLTADNPVQQEHVQMLAPVIRNRLELIARAIQLHQAGDRNGALAVISSDQNREVLKSIHQHIKAMQSEEERLLRLREARAVAQAKFNTTLDMVMVALNVLLAAVVLWMWRRLSRMQDWVTMCSWSRTVEYQGEWLSFDEYLHRRFNVNISHGISPAEMEKFDGELPSERDLR